MQTKPDPRIDAYIEKSAEFSRPIMRHLRRLIHQACPAVEETIKWGMPSFVHAGGILCGMGAFKAHCTFGFWRRGVEATLGLSSAKAKEAMGSFGRIASLADLPDGEAMRSYIAQAAKLNEAGAPARPRPKKKTKPAPAIPNDLDAALRKNKAAAATFDKFSPSHRREYVEWIIEARREETRQKRLATTLEWLAEGKSRNWKYENC